MTGIYTFAGITVQISSIYDNVHKLWEKYRSDSAPDLSVETSEDDIELERAKDIYSHRREYIEELAVYRKISEKIPEYDAFLIHASAVSVEGEGYLFSAPSGTGKSTHTRLWREYFGKRAVMVNDDKPVIRIKEGIPFVCGTPYMGKHRLGNDISVPVKAMFILERSPVNIAEKIDEKDALSAFLPYIYKCEDTENYFRSMELLDFALKTCKKYRIGVNMDISAAKTAFETANSI